MQPLISARPRRAGASLYPPAATEGRHRWSRPVAATVDRLLRWLDLSRERRALSGLSDHQLRDIGVSRADAWQEARKPFWRE